MTLFTVYHKLFNVKVVIDNKGMDGNGWEWVGKGEIFLNNKIHIKTFVNLFIE